MYMGAYSPAEGANIYFGHFGVVHQSGERVYGFPRFATTYEDFTDSHASLSSAELLADWPSSSSLALKSLSASHDDAVAFLGEGAYAGAYFDALYLNKRVGEFLMRALTNLGSMHIVDDTLNTFNLTPESMEAGDLLMQRWQQQGIGHTVVLLDVEQPGPHARALDVAYGSMPRIQPKWKGGDAAESFFTAAKSGGPGVNAAGSAYAALGGGLKRWRTPIVSSGHWRNVVAEQHVEHWINASNLDALAARTATFQALFNGPDASEEKELLLDEIAQARTALRERPSSCMQRSRREEAFESLYALNEGWFGLDREATDRAHRVLDDYVFAELDYASSRTCCWSATTPAMYDMIMAYNEAHTWDEAAQLCQAPQVFKASDEGYKVFADYAEEIGESALWATWSTEAYCPQATLGADTEASHAWTPMCEIADAILDMGAEEPEEEEPSSLEGDDLVDLVGSGWKCGGTPDAPWHPWVLMLSVCFALVLRRSSVCAGP